MKTKLLFAVACLFVATMGVQAQQTFNVDLNWGTGTDNVSTGNWNNFSGSTLGSSLSAIINDAGAASAYNIEVTDDFVAANNSGTTSPDAGLVFPETATRDSFYIQNGANQTGALTISGLDTSKYYSFVIFGSRDGVSDIRESEYTLTGANTASDVLDVSNNTGNTVSINNIQPDGSGNIVMSLQAGAGNTNGSGFSYLGAFQMIETDTQLSVNDFSLVQSLSVSPNPVSDILNIRMNIEKQSKVDMNLYDINGRMVKTLVSEEVEAGDFQYTLQRSSNDNSLSSGMYFLNIQVGDKTETMKVFFE